MVNADDDDDAMALAGEAHEIVVAVDGADDWYGCCCC